MLVAVAPAWRDTGAAGDGPRWRTVPAAQQRPCLRQVVDGVGGPGQGLPVVQRTAAADFLCATPHNLVLAFRSRRRR